MRRIRAERATLHGAHTNMQAYLQTNTHTHIYSAYTNKRAVVCVDRVILKSMPQQQRTDFDRAAFVLF